MGVDFEGNLSWKGLTWRVNFYSQLLDKIHDYVWEGDDEAQTD